VEWQVNGFQGESGECFVGFFYDCRERDAVLLVSGYHRYEVGSGSFSQLFGGAFPAGGDEFERSV
jgi:hypothetical protein